MDFCNTCRIFLRTLISNHPVHRKIEHHTKIEHYMSSANACRLCKLFISCPVTRYHTSTQGTFSTARHHTSIQEILADLPVAALETGPVQIWMRRNYSNGTISSFVITLPMTDGYLRGYMAVWAEQGSPSPMKCFSTH